MGRRKRESKSLAKALTRLASLTSIDPHLDLGGGISLANYQQVAQQLQEKLGDYNTALSSLDEKLNVVQGLEKQLNDAGVRLLAGVASRYGKDSHEYEMAGGTRQSERKRPARKPKAPAAAPPK